MIIYFSGTGNSEWVAKELATILNEHIISAADILLGKDIQLQAHQCERLGFVFPTYSWGPAPVMLQAIAQLQLPCTPTFCYMVTTCGDDVGLSAEIFSESLAAHGLELKSAFSVQMPNNYVCMKGFDVDSKALEQKKLRAAKHRIDEIAYNISTGRVMTDVVRGKWPAVKSKIIRPWFLKHAMSDKKFNVDADKCTQCGLCAQRCPLENITMGQDGPQWNGNCAMCLGCLHRCPTRAINYAHATQAKGRYHFKAQ